MRMIAEEEPAESEPEAAFSSGELFGLSVLSAAVYLILAWLLLYFFHDGGVRGLFRHGYSFPVQLAAGTIAGVLAALGVMFMADRSPVADVLEEFAIFRTIREIRFTAVDRIQLSLFAGVGEEILFRGALQPLIGIWLTSVLFVAIHGYFKFRSAGHLLFGLLMFALSLMLGLLFEHAGLVAAMAAHAVYDILMLRWVKDRAPSAG